MTYPYADEDPYQAAAAATAAPPQAGKQRVLLALVITLGVLILLAFGVLIGGLVLGTGSSSSAHGKSWQQSVVVPAGSRVVYSQVEGNRVVLRVESPGGEELILIDAGNGNIIGRVGVKPSE